jgi:CHAD domain-containing protein
VSRQEGTVDQRYSNSMLSVNDYKKPGRMKKRKELKYLNRLFKKMRQHFKSFALTQTAEALHGFRVQVKKTRSFLTLLEAGNKNDKLLKTFGPVKKIFKSTGIIRGAYIHAKQAKENHINVPGFYKDQEALEQEETGKLLARQHELLHNMKKVKKQLRHQVHPISKKETAQFFTKQISHIQQLLNSNNFTERLHNGRKMLKHLLYNRHIMPRSSEKDTHLNFDDLDTMQQAIGDWHDNKLALDFFSKKLPAKSLATMKQKQQELQKNITAKNIGFLQ